MTLKSKLPLYYYQKYFSTRDSFELFLRKIEVLTDSRLIINSIRALIILLALLMGYMHKTNKAETRINIRQIGISEINIPPTFEQVK